MGSKEPPFLLSVLVELRNNQRGSTASVLLETEMVGSPSLEYTEYEQKLTMNFIRDSGGSAEGLITRKGGHVKGLMSGDTVKQQ